MMPALMIGGGLMIIGLAAMFMLSTSGILTARDMELSAIPVAVEYPAPQLELFDLEGKPGSLANLRGDVILVSNWATWCPPCKEEMPIFEAYYQEHKQKGFTIVAVEAGQSRTEVASFVKSYQLSFPVWLDPQSKSLDAFRNPKLPNSYLIDRDGMIRLAWTGGITKKILDQYVTPFLED
jgi:cytochrome c biogenesis protein CcmG, thiol:disulfide interchange protein DsbE